MKQREVASSRALEATTAAEVNTPVRDKRKRKIVDRMEEEQSCKFWENPLVEKASMAIEVKSQQCDKRNVQR